MLESISDPISVVFISEPNPKRVVPYKIKWHGQAYIITKVGLHHPVRKGKTLFHIFSVTDGTRFFRLSLNTDNLLWTLEEVSDGLTN